MSSKLFAFQLAKPLESSTEDPLSAEYDPQTQMLVWQGGTRAQAVHCTNYYACGGHDHCNAYGSYCTTWENGIGCGWFYWKCD